MSDSRLIERIARTNAFPSDQQLPSGWVGDVLESGTRGSNIVSTILERRSVESKAATRSPNRWRIAIAAIVVAVVAIATVSLLLSAEPDVAEPPTTTVPADPEAALRIGAADDAVRAFYSLDAGNLTDAMDGQSPLDAFQRSARVLNATTAGQPTCSFAGQNQVQCQATTEDDFTRAFGYERQETLTLTFRESDIIASRWVGEHPAYVDPFWTWVFEFQPSNFSNDGACFFASIVDGVLTGGDTNSDSGAGRCWSALVGFVPEFIASDAYTGP